MLVLQYDESSGICRTVYAASNRLFRRLLSATGNISRVFANTRVLRAWRSNRATPQPQPFYTSLKVLLGCRQQWLTIPDYNHVLVYSSSLGVESNRILGMHYTCFNWSIRNRYSWHEVLQSCTILPISQSCLSLFSFGLTLVFFLRNAGHAVSPRRSATTGAPLREKDKRIFWAEHILPPLSRGL